jgi:hypothetical protein
MKKFINFLLTAVVLAFTAACTSELPWDRPNNNDNDARVTLRLNAPGGFNSSKSTRGLTFAQENEINDVYVLVFNNATPSVLVDIKKAAEVSGSTTTNPSTGISGTGIFSVTLPGSTGVGTPTASSRLVVLANVEAILNSSGIGTDDTSTYIGDDYPTVMDAIYTSITGRMFPANSTDRIPMWGETDQIVIAPGNNNQTVRLMRAIARIDVGVGSVTRVSDSTSDVFTWNGMEQDGTTPILFELQEVYVISPSRRFAVVPDATVLTAGNPTLPAGTGKFTLAESQNLFRFYDSDITGASGGRGGWTSRSIYIPEADVKVNALGVSGDGDHINRMAVIVGGDYNGSGTTTFYRLDFAPDGRNLINVLRNNLYQFNIAKVSGAGYPTVEEAYNSLSMNMDVEIIDWDENKIDDIVFDGQYYFGITRREVVFSPFGGPPAEMVYIKTNVSDFSMWELSGTPTNEIQANGTLIFTSGNFGYQYTLTQTGSNTYTLSIYCPNHNVSNSPDDNREPWQIAAKRLRIPFEVSQQWERIYISVPPAGALTRLFPEGTNGVNIPIDVMSMESVTVDIRNTDGTVASWVNEDNNISFSSGIHSGRINLTVPAFRYGDEASGYDGTNDRIAMITLTPHNGTPVRYTIIQESPYINVRPALPALVSVPRTGAPNTITTNIDVRTNVLLGDLSLVRSASVGDATGAGRVQLSGTFYNLDGNHTRNQRFDVNTDLSGVLPVDGFGADFTVSPLVMGKYGLLTGQTARVIVSDMNVTFGTFWWQGLFLDGAIWAPLTRFSDQRTNMIFPWNTESIDFDVRTNIGAEINIVNLGDGTYTEGTPTMAGLTEEIPYSFSFNNEGYSTMGSFELEIASTNPAGSVIPWNFRQGVQIWHRSELQTEVSYAGLPAATTLTVTNNVRWNVAVSPTTATWVTMRTGTNSFVTPVAGSELVQNDRHTVPVVFAGDYMAPENTTAVLTTPTALNIAVANETTLNPAWAPSRSAEINFTNLDVDPVKGGASTNNLTITQWAPVLNNTTTPTGGNLTNSTHTFSVNVTSNLFGINTWGLKLYDVTPGTTATNPLNTWFGTQPASIPAPGNVTFGSVVIPANDEPGVPNRNLELRLFSNEFDYEKIIAEWTQEGNPMFFADLLYLHSDGSLQIGRWAEEVTSSNVLFFTFGSVIGFTIGDGVSWQNNHNPSFWNPSMFLTTPKPNIIDIPGLEFGDVINGGVNTSVRQGVGAYHTGANVRVGKGDPCQLIGLNLAFLSSGASEADKRSYIESFNSGWRLPTRADIWDVVMFPGMNIWISAADAPMPPSGVRVPGQRLPLLANGLNTTGAFFPALGVLYDEAFYGFAEDGYFQLSTANGGFSEMFGIQSYRTPAMWQSDLWFQLSRTNVGGAAVRCIRD